MLFRLLTNFLINLLPVISFPTGITNSLSSVAQWAGFLNQYIPLDTFVSCLAVILGFTLTCWVISAILQLL